MIIDYSIKNKFGGLIDEFIFAAPARKISVHQGPVLGPILFSQVFCFRTQLLSLYELVLFEM